MTFTKSEFKSGVVMSIPMVLAALPFGVLFGTLAVKNGMTIFESFLMSATLFAGASQLVGIELFGANVAPWLIVLSIFAVNFRHILYSAVTGRYMTHMTFMERYLSFFFLIDPLYAMMEERHDRGEKISFSWMMGAGLCFWIPWQIATVIGATFGNLIANPEAIGIDFLLPVYFMSIVMGFRKRNNWAVIVIASGAASMFAYHYVGSPWHVTIGALAGIVVAAIIGLPKDAKLVAE
ncbi:AzlC family ABC transporter permease [Ahrensia kielensis]|uniref:AzlC family ABC transporter permease n=1 Tax=Ahrensia kielensis TaxID=76980 RepID=A0ABU9T5J1_9HYPH